MQKVYEIKHYAISNVQQCAEWPWYEITEQERKMDHFKQFCVANVEYYIYKS
jgi:hypothetical protein